MKITIIGAGNVATVLGIKLTQAGHSIVQVIGRREQHARNLALQLGCDYSVSMDEMNGQAELCLVAISDEGLKNLDRQMPFQQVPVVHTSGSVSKEALKNISADYGVMYPLQSLRKESLSVPQIPFLLDANSEYLKMQLQDVCKSISPQVRFADDDTRLKMHIAAVIVNNFSNHLYVLAEKYCNSEGVDFRFLLPLATETVRRLYDFPAEQLQTGPAVRHDKSTIISHLAHLEKYPEIKSIYEQMTKSIELRAMNVSDEL